MAKVTISDIANFDAAFGLLGISVGPRTGPNKRSRDDKEWYAVRQFLRCAISDGCFTLPISIQKDTPPAPDFVLKRECSIVGYIEHTEATIGADQAELTRSEHVAESTLLGKFGGRYSEGAVGDRPERDWAAAHVIRAIRRKRNKFIILSREPERHLVIYPNSSASFLVDEQDAFETLRGSLAEIGPSLRRLTNGCTVHVFGRESLCFDLLGNARALAWCNPG